MDEHSKDEVEVTPEVEEEEVYEADGADEELPDEEYVDEDTEEYAEEAEEETVSEDEEEDFDFDEDGNIIIPDDEEEDDADDSDGEEAEGDGDGADAEPTTDDTPTEAVTDDKPTAEEKSDDAEKVELRRQLEELRAVAKDTLSKLGVEKTDDALLGLAELAGETEGITGDEYLSRKREADKAEMQRKMAESAAFEQMAQRDLAELHTLYPHTKVYKTIWDMPDDIRRAFGKARDEGWTVESAYAAADPKGIRSAVATAARQKSLRESKSHLTSAVPQGARDTSTERMTKAELKEWRGYFPGMSDKEIVALYRKTGNKR